MSVERLQCARRNPCPENVIVKYENCIQILQRKLKYTSRLFCTRTTVKISPNVDKSSKFALLYRKFGDYCTTTATLYIAWGAENGEMCIM